MHPLDFKKSALDHPKFYRKHGDEHTIVGVATNDMVLMSKWAVDIAKLKSEISQHWEITDGGEKCTGALVLRLSGTGWHKLFQLISVLTYIKAMLNKF